MADRHPRRTRLLSIAATSALLVAAAAGHARAQSAPAEALFENGNKLMAAGKLAEACQAFMESNRIEARAGTLIRLGECREANHQIASAWSAYKDALGRAKDPNKVQLAQGRIAALEPRLSYLTVSVPPAARVAGLAITRDGKPVDDGVLGIALPIDGGDYAIAARAPGHEDWSTVAHVVAEGGKVQIDVPPLREGTPSLAGPVTAPRPVVTPPPPRSGTWTTRREAAIGLGGAAVIAAGVAVGFGLSSKSLESSALDECGMTSGACKTAGDATDANGKLSTARSRATDANIAFGAAAALAIGAGVLWATGAPRAERLAVAPSVAPGLAGLVLVGSFR